MSASRPGSMRGPRGKTPLLLLLLLLTALAGTVLCQDYGTGQEDEPQEEETGNPELENTETEDSTLSSVSTPSNVSPTGPGDPDPGEENPEDGSAEDRGVDPETGTEDPIFTGPTSTPVEEGLTLTIILIPVVLVVLIITTIVICIFIKRRWSNKAGTQDSRKEDPYLDGSSTEKVPMPMFEEDVPSVLELEMEELDQWMQKDGFNGEMSC